MIPAPRMDTAPWQVVVVKHGTRLATRSEAFMNYDFYDEPNGPHRTDYYLWVLRRADEVVVVDTGYTAEQARARGREVLIDPVQALRELGVDPRAGHPVVMTHGHYDHVGNVAAFPHSPIHIARSELDFWTGPMANKRLFAHFGDPAGIEALQRAEGDGRLQVFDSGVEVRPGIRVHAVGGHTPGQAIVTARTTEGVVVLTSDAMHFREELTHDMLFISMTDLVTSYAVLEQLRSVPPDRLISGHDPGELERLAPMEGPLAGLAGTMGEWR